MYAIALVACTLFTGCHKRYWYRIKIDDFHRTYTPVNIRIVNASPGQLSPVFEKQIYKACVKQLRKQGFAPAGKDSPRFEFVLAMSVDTFRQSILMEHTYWTDGTKAKARGGTAQIRHSFEAPTITFRCNMIRIKPTMQMWDNKEDLYFLNQRFRDIIRSKGMVKYMIRTAGSR